MADGRTHASDSWLHGSLSRPAAFVSAACSLVFVFAAAGTPIPLYNTYRAEDGITNADLAIISVGYFLAAATCGLTLGRAFKHLGRLPTALSLLACAVTA